MMTDIAFETYTNLWNACMEYVDRTRANTLRLLDRCVDEDFPNVLKRNATDATCRRWKSGEITRDRAVEITARRVDFLHRKTVDDFEAKLSRIALTPPPDMIEVQVEYRRSQMYGLNPHATVWAMKSNGASIASSATASGGNYDKLSAAVTYAMNANDSCLRVLYDAFENSLAAGVPLPVENWHTRFYTVVNDPATTFGGKPFSPLPAFNTDGAGMSSIRSLFDGVLGFDFEELMYGGGFDMFRLTRRSVETIPAD